MTTVRDQLYFDIFVTALEGGIRYWAEGESYHHWLDYDPDTPIGELIEDVAGFYAEIIEVGDGDDSVRHLIDRPTIARGYALAIGTWRKKIVWSTEPPPIIIDEDTDWDFDAGDADVIVQLGLGLIDAIRSTGQLCVRYG